MHFYIIHSLNILVAVYKNLNAVTIFSVAINFLVSLLHGGTEDKQRRQKCSPEKFNKTVQNLSQHGREEKIRGKKVH